MRLHQPHLLEGDVQLTVRCDERELEQKIRDLARREGISLNRAAIRLLRRGAGLGSAVDDEPGIGSRLDHLAGTWSPEEAEEIEEALATFHVIDGELWR